MPFCKIFPCVEEKRKFFQNDNEKQIRLQGLRAQLQNMHLTFQEYFPRKILNVHRHVDGPWFWTKYSAHPYLGCRSGCEFCYLRGGKYLGKRAPESFDTLIQVKRNAAELLRHELFGLNPDVLACGDWQQPAEERYRLSRAMLEVVREYSFPLFIVERSPLLLRDLDVLTDINTRSWVGVVISFSNLDQKLKQAFEPRSPGLQRRLHMMSTLAQQGILVGASLMPIIPFVGDDDAHLAEAVRATKEHGGQFVLAGGMSMSGVQAECTFAAALALDSKIATQWRQLFGANDGLTPSSSARAYAAQLGVRVRELCERFGVHDRMPRYIPPGPLAINKKIAEKLFLKTYEYELLQTAPARVWAYRKAAWAVDESRESIAALFAAQGEAGLQTLPEIGKGIAHEIAQWLTLENPSEHVIPQESF